MKTTAMLCLAAALTPVAASAKPRKVLMYVNAGFQAQEYLAPRKALEAAGMTVEVATRFPEPVRPGRASADTFEVPSDVTFDKVEVSRYDALVFVGGGGAWTDFFPNAHVHKALTQALARDMTVGLICAAAGLLGTANNLDGQQKPIAEGRRVTGYPQVEGVLRNIGRVNYLPGEKDKPFVVVDGNLVTGRDPLSAELFGQTLVEQLSKR